MKLILSWLPIRIRFTSAPRNLPYNWLESILGLKSSSRIVSTPYQLVLRQQIGARFLQSFQIMFCLSQTLQVNQFMSVQSLRMRLCFGDATAPRFDHDSRSKRRPFQNAS